MGFRIFAVFGYFLIFVLKMFEITHVAAYFVPFYVLVIFVFSLKGYRVADALFRWVSLALGFSFLGDCVIHLTSFPELCIFPFGVAHIALTKGYLHRKPMVRGDIWRLFPILATSTIIYVAVFGDIQETTVKLGFFGYFVVLNVMLWRSFCLVRGRDTSNESWRILVASLLYFVSDILVGLNKLYSSQLIVAAIWVLYPPSLFLLGTLRNGEQWLKGRR